MDLVRNLSTQEKRKMFRDRFQKLVETESRKYCRSRDCAARLTEYVFLKVEQEYEARTLPAYCEPFLIGQTCLAYAATGGHPEEIEAHIEELQAKQNDAPEE